MNAIVYTSNAGSSRRYAEMLSTSLNVPYYSLKESNCLAAGSEIIYIGWVRAGRIVGYKKAMKKFSIKAVCSVGFYVDSEEYVRKKNEFNVPLFMLQGNLDPENAKGFNKVIVKSLFNGIKKGLSKKDDITDSEKIMLKNLESKADLVSIEWLSGVIEMFSGNKI